jgi:hypothetical protein
MNTKQTNNHFTTNVVGNSKSSDEYEVLERILIHPMTIVSKMDSTFQKMNRLEEEICKVESI